MARSLGSVQTLLSPAELSFLHSSLVLDPPIRPDLRTPTQFRPLVAETGVLSSANGSARICFSDGTEAVVGIKAELEKSSRSWQAATLPLEVVPDLDVDMDDHDAEAGLETKSSSRPHEDADPAKILHEWLEVSIEIPGFRDDDNLPVFLSSMLSEAFRADPTLLKKLWINSRWHWKLFIDILSLSPPLSYPLPLLSLTTHLALLNTVLPKLTSEPSDDPLFDDDWAAAIPMYPRSNNTDSSLHFRSRPPLTLLVMTAADNIIFDPSKEELAVADAVLAVSIVPSNLENSSESLSHEPTLQLIAIRTIDSPSRLTPPGIPNAANPATGADTSNAHAASTEIHKSQADPVAERETLAEKEKGKLWTPPRGGVKRSLIAHIVKMVTDPHGVSAEVLAGLANVNV